jgi:carboxypeptidase T
MSWTVWSLVVLLSLSLGLHWALDRELRDVPRRTAVRVQIADEASRSVVLERALDLWSDTDAAEVLDVVLAAGDLADLEAHGIDFVVLSPDIDADAELERARLEQAEAARPGNWFSEYRDYETVDAYLGTLAARGPELVRIQQLGTSVEGRRIRGVRISAAADDAPTIVLNGGQHAREWISVMTSTCIADRLVTDAGVDPRVRAVLDRYAVWVVPVVNPDGYVFSWESDRYWRKNRRGSHGVDLNRNWSVGFGGRGSSSRRWSQIYRGPQAFSEPETRALRDLITNTAAVAHIDFHSFGQLILYPWSHTKTPAPDHDRLAALGDAMATAIAGTHGERYRLSSAQELYTAGGTSLDWSYGERGAMGFTIELRPDGGGNGFVLPPEHIEPTCDEAYAAVLALAERL